jgi:hypothetical protein
MAFDVVGTELAIGFSEVKAASTASEINELAFKSGH